MTDNFDGFNNDNNTSAYSSSYGNGNSSENKYPDSFAYVSNNAPKPKKIKKHNGLKVLAFVLSLGIVAVGSIQGYKIFKGENEKSSLSEFNEDKSETTKKPDSDKDESSSSGRDDDDITLFQLAARTDAKPLPEIVDDIMPSVVGISSTFEAKFNSWGGVTTQQFPATGTGIVLTADGYIITNAHVIYDSSSQYNAGEAVETSVLFSDESVHESKIIAYDLKTDLAVLKVDETGLTPATFGDSDDLKVGELVIAVGNPLGFEFFGTVTSGIVSAKNRQVTIGDKNMTLIQTDAAINAGNSGGPLLNSCGQVIGINSAKMSSSYGSASVEGLGFAIPMNEARVIIDDLINYKCVRGRPSIGITTSDISESYSRYLNIPMGVYVRTVEPGSAAERAGLQEGDVIIEADGQTITTGSELADIKNKYVAGDPLTMTVSRHGKDIEITVILQEEGEISTQN